jgi:hypothetical protein
MKLHFLNDKHLKLISITKIVIHVTVSMSKNIYKFLDYFNNVYLFEEKCLLAGKHRTVLSLTYS